MLMVRKGMMNMMDMIQAAGNLLMIRNKLLGCPIYPFKRFVELVLVALVMLIS